MIARTAPVTPTSARTPSAENLFNCYQSNGTTEATEFTEKEEETLQTSTARFVISVCSVVKSLMPLQFGK
jgi:hypothetical protein